MSSQKMSAIESSFQQYKDHNFLSFKTKVMVKIPKGVQVVLDDIYIHVILHFEQPYRTNLIMIST